MDMIWQVELYKKKTILTRMVFTRAAAITAFIKAANKFIPEHTEIKVIMMK